MTEQTLEQKREDIVSDPNATVEDFEKLGESKEAYIARVEAQMNGEEVKKEEVVEPEPEPKTEENVSHETTEPDKKFGEPEELVDFNGEMVTKTEKRRRDLQSYTDRVIAENNELKSNKTQDTSVSSVSSELKRDGFSDEAIEAELSKRGVHMPTEDEKFENPYDAGEKRDSYKEAKAKLINELKAESEKISKYDEVRQGSLNTAVDRYPDLQDADSELRKACEKYAEENPDLATNPRYELNIANQIASDLGIRPSTYKQPDEQKEVKQTNNKPADGETYIMNGHQGSGASTGAVKGKKLSEGEFMSMTPDQRDEYSKQLHLAKYG